MAGNSLRTGPEQKPMRTLAIIIALVLIVVVAKRLWQQPRRPPAKRNSNNEHMVQCATCGVYIPERDALQRAGHFYCSQAHLDEDIR